MVFIITGLSTGGAEAMLLKLLQHMDRAQYSPQVISLTDRGEIAQKIEALGIPVFALGMRGRWPNPWLWLKLFGRLRAVRPQLVQTWMYHADLIGGLVARMAGVRTVVWGIRNSNLDADKTKRSTRWTVSVCALLSRWIPLAIVSCSGVAKDIHVSLGYSQAKMRVIPNGFDLARFCPDAAMRASVRSELGLGLKTPLVGLIGRFDPQKNHVGFIQAAAEVTRQLSGVHFLLAGAHVDSGNAVLTAQIADANLTDAVHLLGLREDMPRLMASLDVLVSSSYGEAFPNVIGEAMACGVPCVVTNVGDSAMIVGDTGRVVASGDMSELARQVQLLLDMPADQRTLLGAHARKRVAENFEIGHVARQYEDFYRHMVQ